MGSGCGAHHAAGEKQLACCEGDGRGGDGVLTNALPASLFHFRVSPSKVATAHRGHSTATVRLKGLIASVSSALSSPSSAIATEGGMSTALAASARLAKRPSLLGDMVNGTYGRQKEIRVEDGGEVEV